MKRKIAFLMSFIFAFTLLTSNALAENLNDLKKDSKNAKDERANIENKLDENAQKQNRNVTFMLELDEDISNTQSELEKLSVDLEKANQVYEDKNKEYNDTTIEREEKYERFMSRVNFVYENGEVSYLKLLLSSENFNDLLFKAQYVEDIIEYDKKVVKDLEELEALMRVQRDELEEQKNSIKAMKEESEEKKTMLEVLLSDKKAEQEVLKSDESYLDILLEESKAIEAEINKKIENAQMSQRSNVVVSNGEPAYTGGKFGWPTEYYSVNSEYGTRPHPVSGTTKMHTGIDLHATMGSNIFAAEAGVVIMSGVNGGYGNTVMIDHGDGVSTLYAHNSSLVVSVGDSVSRGQVIALAGSTGVSTGPHCHFEVRINGATTNPRPYLF